MIRQKSMAARGRIVFSLYIYIENFKNLLVINQWTDFNITWQECFFHYDALKNMSASWQGYKVYTKILEE